MLCTNEELIQFHSSMIFPGRNMCFAHVVEAVLAFACIPAALQKSGTHFTLSGFLCSSFEPVFAVESAHRAMPGPRHALFVRTLCLCRLLLLARELERLTRKTGGNWTLNISGKRAVSLAPTRGTLGATRVE